MDKTKKIIEQFEYIVGYTPNIHNPKTYNEKIQWLKLFYRNKLLTKCADKYRVREYVKNKIGEQFLIPLIGVYQNVNEINFNNLPNKFVLKTNNGSGKNIICKNKNSLDIKDTKNILKEWMKPSSSHYFHSYEWAYKNIPQKIICEKYLEQPDGDLYDYKFLCFESEPKLIWVDIDRFGFHRRNVYDLKWNLLNFEIDFPRDTNIHIKKPKKLLEMLNLSKRLSNGFHHVRIDMYYVENKIYFGEMTFYTQNGMAKFSDYNWDHKLGKLINIKKIKQENIKKYTEYKEKRKSKIAIYTAISENYDNLIQHTYTSKDFDYICFTDTKIKNPGIWKIQTLNNKLDNVRKTRYYKIHPHKYLSKYKYSIWVDSCIDITSDVLEKKINKLIKKKEKLSVNIHPDRNCIYQEACACIDQEKDDIFTIQKEIEYIKKHKYPKNIGLHETCIIFREHNNKEIIKLMNSWWKMVSKFSKRDQLSFDFVLWKSGIKCVQMFKQSMRKMADDFITWGHNQKIVSSIKCYSGSVYDSCVQNTAYVSKTARYTSTFRVNCKIKNNYIYFYPVKGKYCIFTLNYIDIINKNNHKIRYKYNQLTYNTNGIKTLDNQIEFENTNPEIKIWIKSQYIKYVTVVGRIYFYKLEDKYKNEIETIKNSKLYKLWPIYNSIKKIFLRK